MSIFKGFKRFSEKYSREQKTLFYHSLSIFYFFLHYEHPKGTKKIERNMTIFFSSKRDSWEKVLDFLLNAINVEKKIPIYSLCN